MTISYSDGFLTLLARWKGSVWKSVWKEALLWLSLYYSIRLICILILDDQQLDQMKKTIQLFDSFTSKIPLQFLLGFYVGQVVARWWAQVQTVPWPDDCMVWTNTFFFKDDPGSRTRRRLIARYLILCETLVLRNVSTRIRKRFPTVNSLIEAGLMTEDEHSLYLRVNVENNRWQLPLQWIINGIIVPAVQNEHIPAPGAATLISKINDFRSALRLIYIYDWICIPLVYTQTCSVVVYGYFGFCLIGHQYFGKEVDLYIPYLTIIQFLFFVGWLKVAQDLMKPFGEDDDDVELNVVLDRHAVVAMNFAEELCSLIPRFPWNCPSPQFINGQIDLDNISYIDGVDQIDLDNGTIPDVLGLPYSKAALKSIKNDRPPKMHAHIKLKSPDDEELIGTSTWLDIDHVEDYAQNGEIILQMPDAHSKKRKYAKLTNRF